MRQLIFKQLREQALLALLVAGINGLHSYGALEVEAVHRAQGAGLAASGWYFGGLMLGFDALDRDRRSTARQYVAHRGTPAARLFAARIVAAALALALGPVLAALVRMIDAPNVQVQLSVPERLRFGGVIAIAATSAFWGLGVAALLATFVRTRWRLVAALFVVGHGAWMLLHAWQELAGEHLAPNEWTWMWWNFGASTLALALAARAYGRAHDVTRPLRGHVRPLVGLALLSLAWPKLQTLAAALEQRALSMLSSARPAIIAHAGRMQLADRWTTGLPSGAQILVEPVELETPLKRVSTPLDNAHVLRAQPMLFGDASVELALPPSGRFALTLGADLYVPELRFDLRKRRIVASHSRVDPELAPDSKLERRAAPADFDPHARTVLARSDGRSFSHDVEWIAPYDERSLPLLADSGDLTLWTLAFAGDEPQLVRLELPEGDAWMDWDPARIRVDPAGRMSAPIGPPPRGPGGDFRWPPTGFERRGAPPAPLVPTGFTLEQLDDDPIAPRVVLFHAVTRQRFEHRFTPSALHSALVVAANALRAPVLNLRDFLSSGEPGRGASPSPLCGRRRAGWLALNVAASVLLAFWLVRRRAFGLSRAWWFIALAVGVLGLALVPVLEPRERLPRESSQPTRKLRIAGRSSLRSRARGRP